MYIVYCVYNEVKICVSKKLIKGVCVILDFVVFCKVYEYSNDF